MKTALFFALFWTNIPATAQKKIEKTLKFSPGQEVDLDLKFADSIQVKYWDKPEVYIIVDVKINNGKLDDALLVETSETKQAVKLVVDLDSKMLERGADLSLQSITGEVYSDLAIQFKGERKKNPMVGYNLKGSAGGGGPLLHLESVSNDIYLRSK